MGLSLSGTDWKEKPESTEKKTRRNGGWVGAVGWWHKYITQVKTVRRGSLHAIVSEQVGLIPS